METVSYPFPIPSMDTLTRYSQYLTLVHSPDEHGWYYQDQDPANPNWAVSQLFHSASSAEKAKENNKLLLK